MCHTQIRCIRSLPLLEVKKPRPVPEKTLFEGLICFVVAYKKREPSTLRPIPRLSSTRDKRFNIHFFVFSNNKT
jgi:hypothetical protein